MHLNVDQQLAILLVELPYYVYVQLHKSSKSEATQSVSCIVKSCIMQYKAAGQTETSSFKTSRLRDAHIYLKKGLDFIVTYQL